MLLILINNMHGLELGYIIILLKMYNGGGGGGDSSLSIYE